MAYPRSEKALVTKDVVCCVHCGKALTTKDFTSSSSKLFKAKGKLPYCKKCIEKLYNDFCKQYEKLESVNPKRMAVEHMCMLLDVYFTEVVFDLAIEDASYSANGSVIASYLKRTAINPYMEKRYDDTIMERLSKDDTKDFLIVTDNDKKHNDEIKAAIKMFGKGFSNEDYTYLYSQYQDWIARHECETKSQEEIFKRLCRTQLDLLKADRAGEDTKDLNHTYLKQLEAAKLQPKQNKGETISDTQTFGTLIDKWENTEPIPEMDDDFKDVDRIGKYINIFFKGHLSKMMGIKNAPCKAYDDFMAKYSVTKPEYEAEDGDSEALFDALFGGDLDG